MCNLVSEPERNELGIESEPLGLRIRDPGEVLEADEGEWLESEEPWRDEEAQRSEAEAEIARLEAEIVESNRRQQAFERYLAALGG